MSRSISMMFVLCALSIAGSATPVFWTFSGVTFGGLGGTLSGSFIFDADAGTPCSGGMTPCGVFSSVNITTSSVQGFPGSTYHYVCGQDVAACTGFAPDSTEALFLTSTASDQSFMAALAVRFTGLGGVPPAGLSDAGGVISLVGGAASEGACLNSACTPQPSEFTPRTTTAGVLVGTPEPSSTLLLGWALAVLLGFSLRRRVS